ncbi:MAG: aminopeptidase [Verrucomicrobiales bacterium]|nr:aminopeptidase [Verrucomicrobiales bacterium]
MHDPRIDQLAKQLVRYSTKIKRGEKVLIDLYDVPDSIGLALIRETRAAGGIPFININHSRLSREIAIGANEEQVSISSKLALAQMKNMDAYIALRGADNINELSDVPAKRMKTIAAKMRAVQNYRVNQTRWCVLRWPTASMAQQANMSTQAFEDFYFKVCLLDYAKMQPTMKALKRLMDKTKKVHLKGPGTDLHFSMEGLEALIADGTHNIPDGEVFSSPVKNSIEGKVTFNAPTVYQGIAFDNICLEFEKGKIVHADAGSKTKAINKIFDSDPGARYIGEFAIGFNNEIKHPMRDILFDEKIGGSFHMAAGQAYEGVADNGNRSQIHWDMVNIQRPDYGGGEIYFDGKLIRKNGKFLAKSLQALNP